MPLLEVRDLKTYFFTEEGILKAVDGVSFVLERGKTLGLVGESGCGKSVTALSIMRLVPNPPGRIVAGEILFKDRDLVTLSEKEMQKVRGNEISMIFQEPMTSLNPVFTCGDQVEEAIVLHQKVSKREARARTIELFRLVGIPRPDRCGDEYPHQLSGGMRQRVMIAMALACNPSLLIADEPTTALDVTVQAQILELLRELQERFHTALLLITHDFGIIAEVADIVAVMYAGQIVEQAEVKTIFREPHHPYTLGLLKSVPKITEQVPRLQTIPGVVPSPMSYPPGCRFEPRCEWAEERCKQEQSLCEVEPAHLVRCWKWREVAKGTRTSSIPPPTADHAN